MKDYSTQYQKELRESVIPFWSRYCPDREHGGYLTCLDRDGSVYDTEKFMWMQWRIVWMYAELYNKLEKDPEWLDLAVQGFRFLTQHGKDPKGRYYFALTRDGSPSTAPYSVFSECFAVMGCAALYLATREQEYRREAMASFREYQKRRDNPKGEWEKGLPGKGQFGSLGYYMMQANLALTLADCLNEADHLESLRGVYQMVLSRFWNPELGVMHENVPVQGGFDVASITGRQLNPGHGLEAMWFCMRAAQRLHDTATVTRIADIILKILAKGWDTEYGGIYYFMDALGKPHVELQWDMKLWWVHNEALIAAALAHQATGRTEFRNWFEKIHEWTWSRFPDPEYGEWFGYLNRHGEKTHTLKGGKWKTFFHLPRMLLTCSECLKEKPETKH